MPLTLAVAAVRATAWTVSAWHRIESTTSSMRYNLRRSFSPVQFQVIANTNQLCFMRIRVVNKTLYMRSL